MDPNLPTLDQDAFNAHVLKGVMTGTSEPGETAAEAETRHAAIIEVFRTFEAADAMEASLAGHCISLRYMLEAAMRDAGKVDLEPVQKVRMRASAMSIGKNLHLWLRNFAALHARNEARAKEAQQSAGHPAAAAAQTKPEPASRRRSPARPGLTQSSLIAKPTVPMPPLVPPRAGPERPAATPPVAQMPASGMRQALLSSAARVRGVAADGMLRVSPPGS
jgi:hypothetical protein